MKAENIESCPIIGWDDLTDAEQLDHDWLIDSTTIRPEEAQFVRYRGNAYCLSDMMVCETNPEGWACYEGETYFSRVVFKPDPKDDEAFLCGMQFS